MSYRVAGIDVHKKKLAVVVADVEQDEYRFERRWYGSNPEQLRVLSEWLIEQQVEEVVMESTAQYWKPVWEALERFWKGKSQSREGASRMAGTLHLAQALSNRGRRGRKSDFRDAERLVKRLVSAELVLSFVPDAEQRLWRTLTRTRYQRTRDKVRLQNQLEALLEAPDPVYWVQQGYAVLQADVRGMHKSEGHAGILRQQDAEDYYDLIEWAGSQPWCTGRVGLMGVSYLCMSQWCVAALKPPHLCAMVPWEGVTDLYREPEFHG